MCRHWALFKQVLIYGIVVNSPMEHFLLDSRNFTFDLTPPIVPNFPLTDSLLWEMRVDSLHRRYKTSELRCLFYANAYKIPILASCKSELEEQFGAWLLEHCKLTPESIAQIK